MTTTDVSSWLQEGIAAAKAGEQARARGLLQQVVEADENNLQAWLWLSGVVTTLEDREVCLENVLTLDPANEKARQGLAWVREQIAATPEIEPESILPHVETNEQRLQEAKVTLDFSDAEFDDPLLCVYCAARTREEDRYCPNCKRSLYHSFLKREKPAWLWVGWTLSIADVFITLGLVLILLTILSYTVTAAKFDPKPVEVGQLVQLYFGQTSGLPRAAQTAVFNILPREAFFFRLGYALFTALVTFGLPLRRRVFHLLYIGSLAVSVVGIYLTLNMNRVFIASGAAATPLEAILQVVLNEVLGLFVPIAGGVAGLVLLLRALLAFLMEEDFARVTERLWCVTDRSVREAFTAFVRAKRYMHRGMWTLAALYLQRAVNLQPTAVDYQLALAESYAHLGRYRRSLDTVSQAEQLQPGSPLVLRLKDVILAMELQTRAQAAPAQSAEETARPELWEDHDN